MADQQPPEAAPSVAQLWQQTTGPGRESSREFVARIKEAMKDEPELQVIYSTLRVGTHQSPSVWAGFRAAAKVAVAKWPNHATEDEQIDYQFVMLALGIFQALRSKRDRLEATNG